VSLESEVSHHATKPTGVMHLRALIFITVMRKGAGSFSHTYSLRDASDREGRGLLLAAELISWLKFNLGHRQAPREKPRRSIASQCHTVGLPDPPASVRRGWGIRPAGPALAVPHQAGRASCQVFRREFQWQSGWQQLCGKGGMQGPRPARRDDAF